MKVILPELENLVDKEKSPKSKLNIKSTKEGLEITGLGDPVKNNLQIVAKNHDYVYFILGGPNHLSEKYIGLHIGTPEELLEAKVVSYSVLRDGGTTNIAYELNGKEGHLYFPSPLKVDHFNVSKNTYDGNAQPLDLLTLPGQKTVQRQETRRRSGR